MMYKYRLTAVLVVILFAFGMSGSAIAQTWIEITPPCGPTGDELHGLYNTNMAHYDPVSNRLIVFLPRSYGSGHQGFDPEVASDVWVLTNANGLGGTPSWIKLAASGAAPRIHVSPSVVYDAVTNKLIVYGGGFYHSSPALSPVYVLTNANGLGGIPDWSQSSVINPQFRAEHTAVYDPTNNQMIAFGGHLAFAGTDYNDARVLSNANGVPSPSTWSVLSTLGGPPGKRAAHSAIYDEMNDRMTVFGGSNLINNSWSIIDYDDLWVLSNANGVGEIPAWTQLSPTGGPPSKRSHHSAAYDAANNRMIVFGGLQWNQASQDYTYLGDLWQLSSANGMEGTPTWSAVSAQGTPPSPRFGHSAAYDPINRRLILFGGIDAAGVSSSQVWVLVPNSDLTADITGPPSGSVYPVGTPVTFTGTFSDNPGTHTAQWSFSSSNQNVSTAGIVDEGTGAVSGEYTFSASGVYLVSLNVTNDWGGSGSASTIDGLDALVVIYDPDVAFVTGGGWINSPAGAFAANPGITGKATFGFVSKYQRGATIPTGQTEFQFRVADLNFSSSSYDWLVVAGPKAQYKGSGTINGSGSYGFMLTAVDGQENGGGGVDKFRIKIWDQTSGAIVYDNQNGNTDTADPGTAVGGGSIVIHK